MALSINSNITAGKVAGNLAGHYGRLATSTQRLSTGLRVNSAADDAAGLAIRELMRVDMAAMHQGTRNVNDAISLIQVADGALGVIDEKLIRMKELAEQAATGTYDSTQRLMIDSEFQAMGAEIDRIARATDFNGIHLLDGSLRGAHDGSGLESSGKMKIHFGTANDSAEDYYYVEIRDCTTRGLGLSAGLGGDYVEGAFDAFGMSRPALNNYVGPEKTIPTDAKTPLQNISDVIPSQGVWYCGTLGNTNTGDQNTMFIIPAGSKNVVINQKGTGGDRVTAENDMELFTRTGVHLAGTPLTDFAYTQTGAQPTDLASNAIYMGFTVDDYDDSFLNTGPAVWDSGQTLAFTEYNGMRIGYSGDGGNGSNDYEFLSIDEVTEDLVVWFPGVAGALFQYYMNVPETTPTGATGGNGKLLSIRTQELAQKALPKINDAIIAKDKIRANLGALQNRFENTISNISIQAENLLAAESRISDVDVATEMTLFVHNQILTQAAVAMLSQANSLPQMALSLVNG